MRITQHQFTYWFFILMVIIGYNSCTSETPPPKDTPPALPEINSKIQGSWTIKNAERNGKETNMLDGAFLKFENENKMSTNLTGTEVSYDYDISSNVIQQKGNVEIKYTVEDIQDTTMVVSFMMQGIPFKLALTRS